MRVFTQAWGSIWDYIGRRGPREQNIEPNPDPWEGKYVADKAVKCPPVAISMKEVVQAVATQPPIVANNAYKELFVTPNEYQSWQDFFIGNLNSFLMYGASFIYNTRIRGGLTQTTMKSGKITEMIELPADEMKLVREGSKILARRDSTDDTFDLKETVTYVRDFLGPGFAPVSRIEPVWQDICAINEAYEWINKVFQRGLNIKSVLALKGKMDDVQLQEIQDKINKRYTAQGENSGSFMVIDREANVSQLKGMSPADMELQNFLQAEIRIAAAVFGTPPFSVGSAGDTKYSNHTAETSRFLRSGINPITERYVAEFSRVTGTKIEFDEKALYKGDLMSLVGLAKDLVVNGVITRDEGRNLLQWDALTDEQKEEIMETLRLGGGGNNNPNEEAKPPGEVGGDNGPASESGTPGGLREAA